MKKLTKDLSCLLGVMLCLTGCLEKQYAEADAKISTDRETLSVPSDDSKGVDAVKDTIWVDANRSWSAVLEDNVDWVTIDNLTDGRLNLSRTGDKAPIALSFRDNPDKASRTAKLKVFSEAGQKTVTIIQKELVNRLGIDNKADEFLDLDYIQATYELLINTNCDWTIAVKEGSGIQFEIPTATGSRSAVVDIIVKENPDMEAKTGALIVSAPECAPIEVPFSQIAAEPYVKFPDGQTSFNARDGFPDFDIPVISNAEWSASIDAVEGYPDGSVTTTAKGDKTVKTAHIAFPASLDFSKKEAIITVKFTVKGGKPVYTTITQIPAIAFSCGDPASPGMHVKDMNIWDSKNAGEVAVAKSWFPFAKMEKQNASGEWVSCYDGDLFDWLKASARLTDDPSIIRWTLKNGYVIYTLTQTKGYQWHNKNGWSWGAVIGDYFTSPVVEGHRLSKVVYTHETSTLNLQIKDKFDANFGSVLKPAKTDPADLTIDMKGSVSDMEYKFVLTSTYWFRIGQIVYYYE